ncbi:MAG: gamma-glutamyltransferase [Dehalococcoidia bacterium]
MNFIGTGRGSATRSASWAANGMVCCSQPLAAGAGIEMLKAGGSAIDAAIAVNACLGLMEPTACGLGGDLFAIAWDPKLGKLEGLNASGRAPLATGIDKIPPDADGTIPLHSPYAWSTPGAVEGWFALHERWGRLPLEQVLAPAIRYAESGFPLSPVIANEWYWGSEAHKVNPGFADVFMPGGRAPKDGELFRNQALAQTLRDVARHGRSFTRTGRFAEAIVAYSQANGGFFAMEDFAANEPTWVEPVSTNYRGYDVWELPPNTQGIAALQMLNILEGFDLAAMGRDSADFWHVMVEAKKLAYADRARHYTDPAFAAVPLAELISKDYAGRRAIMIDTKRASREFGHGDPVALNRKETTYLCAADRDGTMVSFIQSNYKGFGSGYAVPELGIGLQNRGNMFSLDPEHPNRLEPGKRPFQTIIPAFLTKEGVPLMPFGLMGGDMQPQGHAQVIVNLVDFGMNLQEAGDAVRFRHTGSSEPTGTIMTDGGSLRIERGLNPEILQELQRRGHTFERQPTGEYGGYQAIWRDPETGVYCGATESRKDGVALGY